MKTLYLLRHAAAAGGLNGLDRDLSAKGLKQSESIGKWMSKNGILPDWIISSSAKRAKLTAKISSELIGYRKSIRFEDRLDAAAGGKYIGIVEALNDEYDSVLVVGHNPAISDVVKVLAGVQLDMSEGMLVCIGFTIDKWTSVKDGDAKLKWFQIPSPV